MCHDIGLEHDGEVAAEWKPLMSTFVPQVVCHPPVSMTEAVPSGTYCLHTCHGHPKVNCKAVNYKRLLSGKWALQLGKRRMTSRREQSNNTCQKNRPQGQSLSFSRPKVGLQLE